MNHKALIFSSVLVNFYFIMSPLPPPPLQHVVLFSMLLTDSWDQELRRHGEDALTLYQCLWPQLTKLKAVGGLKADII